MTKTIDNICKLLDILEYKQYDKLGYVRQLSQAIFDSVHRNIKRKVNDYSYELDFTSQDLRQTAQAITDTFKRWDNLMCPEKNIKKLIKSVKDKKLDLAPFINQTLPIMTYRRDYVQTLTELRNLLEYHSVYLYFLEEASNDEFALKYSKRFE